MNSVGLRWLTKEAIDKGRLMFLGGFVTMEVMYIFPNEIW